MSENTTGNPNAPSTPQTDKVSLRALLAKVELIAQGADKAGVLPGVESYDESTAPEGATRWCASILRILLRRVIEYVVEIRREIQDLPQLRAKMTEMEKLLSDVVTTIRAAQAGQMDPTGPEQGPSADANGQVDPTKSAEALAEAAHHAQVDAMAAAAAAGFTAPVAPAPQAPPQAPPMPAGVTPISGRGAAKKRNSSAGEV